MTLKIDGTNTVANPAFTGVDTDTGLQCGTNELKLVTGGTARVTVDSSGNVGIGTTSPDEPLHISASDPAIKLEDSDGTDQYSVIKNAGGDSIYDAVNGSGTAGAHIFRAPEGSSNEKMRLDTSGRLLVGTSAASSSGVGKIVSRNDVDYSSTEFEDNATLCLQNETNNNSAALLFHSNNSTGSSGRSAIVGGTVNNGKGRLGFYGSCMNKDSSTDADVTIDADGRVLVGTVSSQSDESYIQSYRATGNNYVWLESNHLNNNGYSMFRAYGSVNGSNTRQAWLGVHKHSGITNACAFIFLEAEDGQNLYMYNDNSNKFRISTTPAHIGTTSGVLVGSQTSDLRLKNVGANVSYGLAEVKQLQPKQYALKDDPDVNCLGFIAQEVESIIPEAVYDTREELDGHQEGDRTKLGMEYVQLIPVLVNAIKELSAEVDTLKTKVAALEAAE